jgi:hypothetical protein
VPLALRAFSDWPSRAVRRSDSISSSDGRYLEVTFKRIEAAIDGLHWSCLLRDGSRPSRRRSTGALPCFPAALAACKIWLCSHATSSACAATRLLSVNGVLLHAAQIALMALLGPQPLHAHCVARLEPFHTPIRGSLGQSGRARPQSERERDRAWS